MKLVMIFIMFLLIGAFFVMGSNNLDISDKDDWGEFSSLYLSWLGHVASNSWKTMGYAIKLDWLPDSDYNNSKASEKTVDSDTDSYG